MNFLNWYKLSFRNPNDLLATKLSREIFSFIKENAKSGNKEYSEKSIGLDNECSLSLRVFHISLKEDEYLRYGTFEIGGLTDISRSSLYNPKIEITLTFDEKFSYTQFDQLYHILEDAIRHEIEHYYNYKAGINQEDNEIVPSDKILDFYRSYSEYLLNEAELEPYIRGLMFITKKRKVPFTNILDESLDGIFFSNIAERKNKTLKSKYGKEISDIITNMKNAIIARTKQIFPNMR